MGGGDGLTGFPTPRLADGSGVGTDAFGSAADRYPAFAVEGLDGFRRRWRLHPSPHGPARHMHRYLAEFEFRYNNRVTLGVADRGRARAVGKRLTYTASRQHA